MNKTLLSLGAIVALSACGETVTQGGAGSGQQLDFPVPEVLAGQLVAATYNPVGQTLTLNIDGFDGPRSETPFSRNAALDFVSPDGSTTYYAFTEQTTVSNRVYTAFVAEGDYLQAGAVATESEHGRSFGGAFYAPRSSQPAPTPSEGSAIFRGGYRGLWKAGAAGEDRATATSGEVVFSVNLTEAQVEGTIFNKCDDDDGSAMPTIYLTATDLEAGSFFGEAYIGDVKVGEYGGLVAGEVANSSAGANNGRSPAEVAGVGAFKPFVGNIPLEYGVFILPVCGGPSEASTCP